MREIICLDCGGPVRDAAEVLRGAGWEINHVHTPGEAEQAVVDRQARIALAVFGNELPESSNLRILEDLFENTPKVAWVALVEPALLQTTPVPHLIANYCRDYLTAPFQSESLLHSVGHAHGMATMDVAILPPGTDLHIPGHEMLAHSHVMQQVVRTLRKCAKSHAPVMITGESGTGKELAALAIHHKSARNGGPFVAVNCGAIPETLIQAELFGHVKGAFTGADRDKVGRIEAARGGTLFLDEIGDLSLPLQVNLLRFLQEGIIEKVGAHQPIHVDTRVIAATHKDLEAAVEAGEFREDLYYRLNVLRVPLPPLRERGDDIEPLARAYLDHFTRLNRGRAIGFSQQALNLIKNHDWPGNIRELVNRIQRAVIMSERRLLTPADLGLNRRSGNRTAKTLEQARGDAEKEALSRSLRYSGHNIAETARCLGVSRLTVYRLMEKHGMDNRATSFHDGRSITFE